MFNNIKLTEKQFAVLSQKLQAKTAIENQGQAISSQINEILELILEGKGITPAQVSKLDFDKRELVVEELKPVVKTKGKV